MQNDSEAFKIYFQKYQYNWPTVEGWYKDDQHLTMSGYYSGWAKVDNDYFVQCNLDNPQDIDISSLGFNLIKEMSRVYIDMTIMLTDYYTWIIFDNSNPGSIKKLCEDKNLLVSLVKTWFLLEGVKMEYDDECFDFPEEYDCHKEDE